MKETAGLLESPVSPATTNGEEKKQPPSPKRKLNGRRPEEPPSPSSFVPTHFSKNELKQLLHVMKAVRQGDFSVRCTPTDGIVGEIGEVMNDLIEMNEGIANEFTHIAKVVGQEGKMTERASIGRVKGAWGTIIESVNSLIGDLVQPTNEVARVITSVAKGDLSQKISLDIDGRSLKGEFFRIGTTVNSMVDQLNSFAAEVTRVAKEVGTEGKLGGQADVKGVSGVWKDLTDNVNGLNLREEINTYLPQIKGGEEQIPELITHWWDQMMTLYGSGTY